VAFSSKQQGVLIRLYNEQPNPVDSIKDSDLSLMGLQLLNETGHLANNAQIVKELIRLRKNGDLPQKTDRKPRPKPDPTWPKELKGKYYEVPVMIPVGFDEMAYAIYIECKRYDGRRPVTRGEVYKIFQERGGQGYIFHDGDWEHVDKEDVEWAQEVTRKLFPEFER
jgi:hypothetical protein